MRSIAALGLIALGVVSCAPSPPPAAAPVSEVRTVKYRGGNTYSVEVVQGTWRGSEEPDSFDEQPLARTGGPTIMVAAAAKPKACTAKPAQSDGRSYYGTDREIAKTTLPEATIESFGSVSALRKDIRANSDDFEMMDSGITKHCDELRVKAERRMVIVVGYLYAATKENDNDYHLILGTKDCKDPDCFMTAEVTGVPRLPKNRPQLEKARNEFEEQIGEFTPSGGLPPRGPYLRFRTPVPVRVTGPLFYDADHEIDRKTREGAVGPDYATPSTSWEIHPVVRIEIEPTSNGVPLNIAQRE
jgi:hypothetical protein